MWREPEKMLQPCDVTDAKRFASVSDTHLFYIDAISEESHS
jgi:hypothetical protein